MNFFKSTWWNAFKRKSNIQVSDLEVKHKFSEAAKDLAKSQLGTNQGRDDQEIIDFIDEVDSTKN